MTANARVLAPAVRCYRGGVTSPERWGTWTPREGDILVTTPAKCGTTWTQTILTMLVRGTTDLPQPVPVLSPWVDADLGVPAEKVEAALAAQTGRRVVKTHTPADGFPVWEGITVVAVYRHPLDVFFSLRKHTANRKNADPDDPDLLPVPESFQHFIRDLVEVEKFGPDPLSRLVLHYRETACSGRVPDLKLFHYADMRRDGRWAVEALAKAVGVEADADLLDRIAEATSFGAMKRNAANFTPVAGTGFWRSDENFFDSGTSMKWKGQLSEDDLAQYRACFEEYLPDPEHRAWLENGSGAAA